MNSSVASVLSNPVIMAKVHGILVLVWITLAIATTSWALYDPDSKYLLAWVIAMSAYANAAAHWSARQGAAPSAGEVSS